MTSSAPRLPAKVGHGHVLLTQSWPRSGTLRLSLAVGTTQQARSWLQLWSPASPFSPNSSAVLLQPVPPLSVGMSLLCWGTGACSLPCAGPGTEPSLTLGCTQDSRAGRGRTAPHAVLPSSAPLTLEAACPLTTPSSHLPPVSRGRGPWFSVRCPLPPRRLLLLHRESEPGSVTGRPRRLESSLSPTCQCLPSGSGRREFPPWDSVHCQGCKTCSLDPAGPPRRKRFPVGPHSVPCLALPRPQLHIAHGGLSVGWLGRVLTTQAGGLLSPAYRPRPQPVGCPPRPLRPEPPAHCSLLLPGWPTGAPAWPPLPSSLPTQADSLGKTLRPTALQPGAPSSGAAKIGTASQREVRSWSPTQRPRGAEESSCPGHAGILAHEASTGPTPTGAQGASR